MQTTEVKGQASAPENFKLQYTAVLGQLTQLRRIHGKKFKNEKEVKLLLEQKKLVKRKIQKKVSFEKSKYYKSLVYCRELPLYLQPLITNIESSGTIEQLKEIELIVSTEASNKKISCENAAFIQKLIHKKVNLINIENLYL